MPSLLGAVDFKNSSGKGFLPGSTVFDKMSSLLFHCIYMTMILFDLEMNEGSGSLLSSFHHNVVSFTASETRVR